MIYRRIVDGAVREEQAGSVAFDRRYDVIVAGAGTAGAYAVLAAALQGVRVLGIDKNAGVGGMGTYGYVSAYYYGAHGGLFTALDDEAEALGDEMFLDTVEAKRYLLERKILAAGGELMLQSRVTGVYLEGSAVRGVSVLTGGRTLKLGCSVAIDATAEAELCWAAGCDTRTGRDSDGRTRPFTSVKVWLTGDGHIARTNHDGGYVDQYDAAALTAAILSAHGNQLLGEFRNDNGKVLFLAPQIGVREGKLVVCEDTLAMDDVLDGEFRGDPLFYAYSDFDKHGRDNALESTVMRDWYVNCNLSTVCFSVPVSARNLIPRGYRSLLVAGRHLGMDHDVASLVRMKRDMHRCGESAGVLAAAAVRMGLTPGDVPYDAVRETLMATGCLNDDQRGWVRFDDRDRRMDVPLLTRPEDIRAELATDRPGIALYSCRRLGAAMVPHLRRWMAGADPMLATASALALGLMGHGDSLPVLLDIVERRDCFFYQDCRRTNQLRTAMALCLMGKLGDEAALPVLYEIVGGEDEYEKPLYHTLNEPSYRLGTGPSFNAVYFQIVSHATAALVRILAANPHRRAEGAAALRRAYADDTHVRRTTALPPGSYEYEVAAAPGRWALHSVRDW